MNIVEAFTFCPRCGNEFSDKKGDHLKCAQCGLSYYTSPKPCAGILPVNDKGEILLTRRALEPHKGKLDMLGGFVQDGETLEEGAAREAQEELGVVMHDFRYLASYTHGYTYQNIDYTLVTAIFSALLQNDSHYTASDDITEYMFIKPQDVTAAMLAFPGLKKTIDSIA